jgi:DNA-binding MarR family transcriptional regulator
MTPPPAPLSYPDEARTMGSLLRAPYRKLQERLFKQLAENGFPEIRVSHSAVLRHLPPVGARLVDLAEQAEMTKQSMAYLVGYLETHGYVEIQPDPSDGRAKLVLLTERGHCCAKAAVEISAELEREAGRRIGVREVARLRKLLSSLDEALGE